MKRKPRYIIEIGRLHTAQSVSKVQIVALRIARKYRQRPSIDSLVAEFGMCKATAYRWRAAWDYVWSETDQGQN